MDRCCRGSSAVDVRLSRPVERPLPGLESHITMVDCGLSAEQTGRTRIRSDVSRYDPAVLAVAGDGLSETEL